MDWWANRMSETNSPLDIVCVQKWSEGFPNEYVHNLYNGLKKHITKPFDFTVFTNQEYEEYNTVSLKYDWHELYRPWWCKMEVFRPDTGINNFLYLDLDTVITKNIDYLFTLDRTTILANLANGKYGETGIYYMDAKDKQRVWNRFINNPKEIANTYRMDGRFVWHTISPAPFLQTKFPGEIISYKYHKDQFDTASIICFHGKPKPHEVEDEIVLENWGG